MNQREPIFPRNFFALWLAGVLLFGGILAWNHEDVALHYALKWEGRPE